MDEATSRFLHHFMDEYGAFVERVLAVTAPGHIGDQDHETNRLVGRENVA